jgi:molybdopterin/thiamine biosynthesis adenylyltransferase
MAMSGAGVQRYARHLMLKEIGGPGQQRLGAATVAIVGLGGLGAPAALYLAAAGVGRLRLIDPDRASLSNLQRQILYQTSDIDALKVERAARALEALNPEITVAPVAEALTVESADRLLTGADVVLDGTDSFAARDLANAACHRLAIPLVAGAVIGWDGWVSVFANGRDAAAPCYRCLAPQPPHAEEHCATVGVVGAAAGVIGTLMALEAIKLITGAGAPLMGRVLHHDGLAAEARILRLAKDPACPVCGCA